MAIAFDNSAQAAAVGTGNIVISGSNKLAAAFVTQFDVTTQPSVTLAGTSMTVVGSNVNNLGPYKLVVYAFYMVDPPSGTQTFSTTFGGNANSVHVASYTGVKQTGQPDATNRGSGVADANMEGTITTVADNSWSLYGWYTDNAYSSFTNGVQRGAGTNGGGIADSNAAITPAGAYIQTLTTSGGNTNFFQFSISPDDPTVPFSYGTAGTGIGTTNGVDTTGMSLIVLYESYDGSGTVSDNKSNTWTALTERGTGQKGRMYYSINPTVGTGHKFITSVSYGAILMEGFTATNSVYYSENGNFGGSSTSLSTGAVTPSGSNSLVVSGLGLGGAAPNASSVKINSGFGIKASVPMVSGVNYGGNMAHLIQGLGSSVNPSWSWTNNAVNTGAIAVFEVIQSTSSSGFRSLLGVGI